MTIFQSLPPSVLQAGAIFLSIMIEALPFVLIGSLISGLIEVYITPDKVYEFLPRNRWGRIFWYLHWLSLSFLRMWYRSDYQSFSGKESAQLHSGSFSGDCSHHQSYRSFRHIFCLWQFNKTCLLASSGSYCDCFDSGDFPRIFLEGTHSKENPIACHEHDFSQLGSQARKCFRSLYKLLMSFSIWGVTWSLAVSLRLSCRSMSRPGS